MTARLRREFAALPRSLRALCAGLALLAAAQAASGSVHAGAHAGTEGAAGRVNQGGARAAASFEAASQADLGGALASLQGLYGNSDWKTTANGPADLTSVSLADRVPEPSTWVLLLAGLAAVVVARARR